MTLHSVWWFTTGNTHDARSPWNFTLHGDFNQGMCSCCQDFKISQCKEFMLPWHQYTLLIGAHVACTSIPLHRRYSYMLQGQQHPGSLRHHLVLHEAGITMGGAHADGSSQGQLFLLPLWPKKWPDSCLYSINTLISCRE